MIWVSNVCITTCCLVIRWGRSTTIRLGNGRWIWRSNLLLCVWLCSRRRLGCFCRWFRLWSCLCCRMDNRCRSSLLCMDLLMFVLRGILRSWCCGGGGRSGWLRLSFRGGLWWCDVRWDRRNGRFTGVVSFWLYHLSVTVWMMWGQHKQARTCCLCIPYVW